MPLCQFRKSYKGPISSKLRREGWYRDAFWQDASWIPEGSWPSHLDPGPRTRLGTETRLGETHPGSKRGLGRYLDWDMCPLDKTLSSRPETETRRESGRHRGFSRDIAQRYSDRDICPLIQDFVMNLYKVWVEVYNTVCTAVSAVTWLKAYAMEDQLCERSWSLLRPTHMSS